MYVKICAARWHSIRVSEFVRVKKGECERVRVLENYFAAEREREREREREMQYFGRRMRKHDLPPRQSSGGRQGVH